MPLQPWPLASWSMVETVPVFFMCFGVGVYLEIVLAGVLHVRGDAGDAIAGVLTEGAFLVPIVIWLRRAKHEGVASLGLGPRAASDIFSGVGMGLLALVATFIVIGITFAIATAILGHDPVVHDPIGGNGGWHVVGLVTAVLAAPICEEVLFRGFLFQGLRRRYTFWPAALLASTAFAIAHFDLLRIPNTFVAGLLLATIFERRKSLYAPIATHLVVNGTIVWLGLIRH